MGERTGSGIFVFLRPAYHGEQERGTLPSWVSVNGPTPPSAFRAALGSSILRTLGETGPLANAKREPAHGAKHTRRENCAQIKHTWQLHASSGEAGVRGRNLRPGQHLEPKWLRAAPHDRKAGPAPLGALATAWQAARRSRRAPCSCSAFKASLPAPENRGSDGREAERKR